METASLVIKVDSTGAERATRNLDKLDKAAGGTERAAHKLGKAWGAAIGLVSAAAITSATRAFVRQADAMANLNARLGLVVENAQELAKAQKDVFNIAQSTATDLEATADLYTKLAQSSDDLRGNQDRLAGVVRTVSEALVVSGADAAATASVIRQFSQALASGALRGDEFISVMEGAPRLARAIADGLGVPIGKLRELAAEGKLTAQTIIKALEEQGAVVEAEYGRMPLTVGRAVTKVQNSLSQLISETDEASGATESLAGAIDDLANVLSDPETQKAFNDTASAIANIAKNAIVGAREVVGFMGDIRRTFGGGQEDLAGKIAGLRQVIANREKFTGEGSQTALRAELDQLRARYRDEQVTASLREQFAAAVAPLPDKERPTATGNLDPTRERTKATKELSAAQKLQNELEADYAAIVEMTAGYETERAIATGEREVAIREAQKATAALIDEMQFELSLIGKTREEQARLTAERWVSADATDDQRRAVGDLAVAIERASESEAYVDDLKSAVSGLFMAIGEGSEGATAAFERMIDTMKRRAADALADRAIEGLIQGFAGMMGGGGWAGFTSGFTKGFSGGGRAGGGPVMAGGSYLLGEQGPEVVTFGRNGNVTPNHKLGGVGSTTANVKLEVINNGQPMSASTSQQKMPDGTQLIRLVLDAVGESIAAGTGPVYSAQKSRFGLRDAV